MKRELVVCFLVLCAVAGCKTGPPAEVVSAIRTVETQVDVYVQEANWALERSGHADRELLIGTGERLRRAVRALSAWAQASE